MNFSPAMSLEEELRFNKKAINNMKYLQSAHYNIINPYEEYKAEK